MKTADIQKPHVRKFCSSIATKDPVCVKCEPQASEDENECFQLVQEKVDESGGKMVTGWAIWEKPGVFIEAEFHAVWVTPESEYIDLNPRPSNFKITEILFIPDNVTQYKNQQIDNIRKALVDDDLVKRFLFLNRKYFEFMNRGERAFQHGHIELTRREQKEYKKLLKSLIQVERKIHCKYPQSVT